MTHPLRLIPFLFEGDTTIRITDQNGDPWFIAADVCRPIGIKNHRQAIAKLDEDEKGVIISDTLGGPQELLTVSESGLYALVLRSHAAMEPGTKAHRFRKWVTGELIPSIRKTGHYTAHASLARNSVTDEVMALSVVEKMKLVSLNIRAAGQRAGCEMMAYLGFPMMPSAEVMLRQAEFKFIIDLDTNGPIDVAEVN